MSKQTALKSNKPRSRAQNPVEKRFFWVETKNELSRVSWPTRDVLLKSTSLVVLIMVVSTLFIGIADIVLSQLFSLI